MEFLFLLIGLGFFVWTMRESDRSYHERQQQRIAEMREFGFDIHHQERMFRLKRNK